MTDIATRLRDLYGTHPICVEAANEIDLLRATLGQALRQWKMYAEASECRDDFDFETEQSAEADVYRAALNIQQRPEPK